MKQRGAAVVPDSTDKNGKDLNKELADMRRRKATLEATARGRGKGRGLGKGLKDASELHLCESG